MPLNTYYDRSATQDPEYAQHRFMPGRGLQSAELNEIQVGAASRLKRVADSLFKDGDIIRDCQILVNSDTGVTTVAGGAIYISGDVRGVAPGTFTIPIVGTVNVGIRMIKAVVTATEDPTLLDPATGTGNVNKPGADRLKEHIKWGYFGDADVGDFYPVYTVIDGFVNAKEPPPNLDAFAQQLARYDRDSAGGMYIVSGLDVKQLADVGGNQIYSLAEGRARVYGAAIEFSTARRITYAAVPDLRAITNEPHTSTTVGAQRINFNRAPGTNIVELTITAEKTVTLTHGVSTGAQDPLPDTSVLAIIEVKQGGTTYTETTDYLLTSDKVNWSPAGSEPAPGSTYTCKYQYLKNVTPTAVDDTGFTVTGAVVSTLVLVSYSQKLPRIDRLCVNQDGAIVWLVGVSADYSPQPPTVPGDLLSISSVYQTWDINRRVTNDGVKVVTMPVLAALSDRIDLAMQLIAQNTLESDIHAREAGAKLGLFTDPFIDDTQRDAGHPQTAAVVVGELSLPIDGAVSQVSADITKPVTADYTQSSILAQPLRTSTMKINPYSSFGAVPARMVMTPAVDRWTNVTSNWTSPITARFAVGNVSKTLMTTRTALLPTTTSNVESLRQVDVSFKISGFAPGEALQTLTFDGVTVTPVAV